MSDFPHIKDLPDAKIVPANASKQTALGTTVDANEDRPGVETVVAAMVASGDVVPREPGSKTDTENDAVLRESFGHLYYAGIPRSVVRRVLALSPDSYWRLKKQLVESAVESLQDVGVAGSVAMSFDSLEFACQEARRLIATTTDPADRTAALRLLKDLESEKVSLLIKTGIIKVTKKVELSGTLQAMSNDNKQLSGPQAADIMVRIVQALVTVDAEEEKESGDEQ